MEKEQFLRFKEDLKKEAKEQKELKNQRKSVHIKGERTINPYDAAWKARSNRWELDKKYVIYYILKHRIEVTPKNLEEALWTTYAKLHPQYKEARHVNIVGWDNHKSINYFLDTPNGRDYTPENAMYDLIKRYDKIIKQYGN